MTQNKSLTGILAVVTGAACGMRSVLRAPR